MLKLVTSSRSQITEKYLCSRSGFTVFPYNSCKIKMSMKAQIESISVMLTHFSSFISLRKITGVRNSPRVTT